MYDSTFEGGMVALLNTVSPIETPYETYLREAWAPYDLELKREYGRKDDNG